jgi:proline-specific peptidase
MESIPFEHYSCSNRLPQVAVLPQLGRAHESSPSSGHHCSHGGDGRRTRRGAGVTQHSAACSWGCNNSDQPDDASLWTLARYTAEVEEVRRGLGLEQFVLFGHSWGGILAMEYALHHQQHLRGLVISNMTAGVQAFLKLASFLKSQLPPQTLARLTALEAKEDYDSPEYQKIMMEDLYPEMLCRINPWPEPVTRAFRHANDKIYNFMQGKSDRRPAR